MEAMVGKRLVRKTELSLVILWWGHSFESDHLLRAHCGIWLSGIEFDRHDHFYCDCAAASSDLSTLAGGDAVGIYVVFLIRWHFVGATKGKDMRNSMFVATCCFFVIFFCSLAGKTMHCGLR